MKCPYCSFLESKVIDSRPSDEGVSVRRRRECLNCQKRFTTYEIIERLPLIIVKKDKTRVQYDRNKLLNGIVLACQKRPVSMEQIQKVVDEIETALYNTLEREVTSQQIGELVMKKLKVLDEVAYVRFASVYRQFKDLNTFMDELTKLLRDK
jgi:transcriptional repressor NrdR